MMLPGVIYLIINNYIPMAGLIIAFKDLNFRKGILGSDWIGFANFRYLFATSDALLITRNTVLYNVVFIALNNFLGVTVAILLNDMTALKAKKFYQSAVLLPYLISMVIISYLVFAFLSNDRGFLNRTVLPIFGQQGPSWYTNASLWPPILIFVNAWKNVGYLCVLYLSSILGINKEFYEAASLEGASKWQQIKYITLPLIKPTIIMMVLIMIGKIFYADFGLFYHVPMDSGALYKTTNVIDTYVYRGLLKTGDVGMSSAAGLYQSVVGFILVLTSNLVVRKVSPENALF
ncbi:MAG: sugar ABC transporter permease [Clostridia bacterium]|nr:sugar ABC transporter permease [Clostridia bacterium]